jgi:hypothetical protein
MSVLPPGVNGTTMRIERPPCAWLARLAQARLASRARRVGSVGKRCLIERKAIEQYWPVRVRER